MHLVQCLLQAILLAGIDTYSLQRFQLGRHPALYQILHREGVPDTLLILANGILLTLRSQNHDQCKAYNPADLVQQHADGSGNLLTGHGL